MGDAAPRFPATGEDPSGVVRLDRREPRDLTGGSQLFHPVAKSKRRGAPSQGRRTGHRCRGPSVAMTSLALALAAPSPWHPLYAPSRVSVRALWEKFADDGDLTGLKIFLLTAMIFITALLEGGR